MGTPMGFSDQTGAGKGNTTSSLVSGQPSFGQPNQNMMPQSNQYPNTVGPWDNASIQQPQQDYSSGKSGKGGSQTTAQPYSKPLDVYTPAAVTPVNNPSAVQQPMQSTNVPVTRHFEN